MIDTCMNDIDYSLETALDVVFGYEWNADYMNIKPSFVANRIYNLCDLCRLSMEDLVVITGHLRYDLYFLAFVVDQEGFHLGMSEDEITEYYTHIRLGVFWEEVYKERIRQLNEQGNPNAVLIADREREAHALPVPEGWDSRCDDEIMAFRQREARCRTNIRNTIEAMRMEIDVLCRCNGYKL